MLQKNCLVCKQSYFKRVNTSLKDWVLQKYCSQKCAKKTRIGHTPWNKGTKGIMKAWNKGKKGLQIAWNKGVPGLKEEESKSWKGDYAGYSAKHKWIENKLGKPTTCEHCGKTGLKKQQIHWSNIDHKYRRVLSDWQRLCAQCHLVYDREKFL